ncbi:MAG TPA: response regulator [Vicinamibacterales bacterium]|jgi:DNA-binding NtrC family response regulator|nr:response regulator [Vicinamibacterales bacterium]
MVSRAHYQRHTIVNMISGREKVPPSMEKFPALRILVVDDEALIRWSLVQTLNDSGHETEEAWDAATAIRTVAETPRPFDVALLDLCLPDSKGLELLSEVRRLAPKTQVILMTAYGTPEIVERAIDLGAFRVVGKPLEMNDITPLVASASRAAG